jgi:hypothetical protein
MPRFVKRALGAVLSALLFLAVLGIAGKLLYNHFFPSQDDNRPAAETGGGTYHTHTELSTEPYEAVRTVYDAIAQNSAPMACGRFRDDIQQKFATDMGYQDCQLAVEGLHAQVTNENNYAESISPRQYDPNATNLTIDSCDFSISGGPSLGRFVVTRVERGQWLITGHEPGPTTCPPPSTAPSASGTPTG